jgi:manganese oxidase
MFPTIGRRNFLKLAGATGAATLAGGIATQAQDPTPTHLPDNAPMWQIMDQHHQEGIDAFLANAGTNPSFWNNPLEFEMDGDVKVFRITCQEVDWETQAGMTAKAMTYNGTIPGPEIRVTEGDRIRVIVTNEMTQSTAMHWHGLIVPNDQDGVPLITQPLITPGSTFTYEFDVVNYGTHMYHSHHNSAEQVTRGLLGPFIVEPRDESLRYDAVAEYNFVMNDSGLGTFTFNGKGFPYTQPIIAKKGEKILVRYFNEGFMIHPMHLHGIPQRVMAKDGFPLAAPQMLDTLNIAPGERYDVEISCDYVGVWAFHCHILNHAEAANGMFGMVTVLIVQDA